MGYACPVCEDPQADAEHLANHLAFTAMLREDGHAAWLDEHVPEWDDLGPPELAERVTDHAEEREYPQVFEDTTGGDQEAGYHDHAHDHRHDHRHRGGGAADRGPGVSGLGGQDVGDPDQYDTEGDPEDVMAEARELTRRMRENAASDETEDGDAGDEGSDEADGAETGDDTGADDE